MNRTKARCKDERIGCFANALGQCMILTDIIRRRPCPFYKTEEQIESEREATRKKLKSKGIYEMMVEKYGDMV